MLPVLYMAKWMDDKTCCFLSGKDCEPFPLKPSLQYRSFLVGAQRSSWNCIGQEWQAYSGSDDRAEWWCASVHQWGRILPRPAGSRITQHWSSSRGISTATTEGLRILMSTRNLIVSVSLLYWPKALNEHRIRIENVGWHITDLACETGN